MIRIITILQLTNVLTISCADSKTLSIQLIQKYGVTADVAEHLAKSYGSRAGEVCELAASTKDGFQPLVHGFPYIVADVTWACREYACTVEDVLSRRTRLAFLDKDAAMEVIPRVAEVMATELGWSTKVQEFQTMAAEKYVESYGGGRPVPVAPTAEMENKELYG